MKKDKTKGYFVFFDEEKKGCLMLEIEPEQLDIKDDNHLIMPKNGKGLVTMSQKDIVIRISPMDVKGEPNLSWITLMRKRVGGMPILDDNGEYLTTTPIKYLETKEEYLKREKDYIKKTIKR